MEGNCQDSKGGKGRVGGNGPAGGGKGSWGGPGPCGKGNNGNKGKKKYWG